MSNGLDMDRAVNRLDWIMAAPAALDEIRGNISRVLQVEVYHAGELPIFIAELIEELEQLRRREQERLEACKQDPQS